jgi:predicted signal transduction protein with EAL and GGDEF domain
MEAITTLAHNLGMMVVVEGIETYHQLKRLNGLKCDLGQGYLFSKPIVAKAAENIIVNVDAPLFDTPVPKSLFCKSNGEVSLTPHHQHKETGL